MRRSRSRLGGFRMRGTAGRLPTERGADGRVRTFRVGVASGFFAAFLFATGFATTRGLAAGGRADFLERFAAARREGAAFFEPVVFREAARFFAAAFRPLVFLEACAERCRAAWPGRLRGAFFEACRGVRAAFRLAMARPFKSIREVFLTLTVTGK